MVHFSFSLRSLHNRRLQAYQQVLAVEVKNFAKITTFLSFNTTAVFLHDIIVQENDVLEVG